MSKSQPKTHYLKDYTPCPFVVESVNLHFDLGEDVTHVKGILHLARNPNSTEKNAPLYLDGEELQLVSVRIDGRELDKNEYRVDDKSLTIDSVPDQFILETEVAIKPQDNTQLMGLYKSRNNFCTQCEAEGFRRITYYFDRPDVMSRFTTTITADSSKYPMLLSNGNLIETKTLGNGRHWVHWEDPSLKPCYLFALVAGDFDLLEDSFTTMSGRRVALKLYLEKGFADQGTFAVEALKHAMQWDEEAFGREYDLDVYMIVAVSDFNMGAMENKGLNIFNTKYILAKPETATDADYAAVEFVIGHEYFHNWSGNRVTCRDWFQITLKEGLTVFREQLFHEAMTSASVARLDSANVVRNAQFLEDAGPMAHPIRPDSYIEINNFYTVTVYRKGSEVIRMLHTLLTPEGFRKAMDLYFSRHDGQAVTTEEFVKAMEDASGRDLSQFRRWYSQAGTPVLHVKGDYDEAAQTYTLTVKQTCPATPGQKEKLPFHLPLVVGLIGANCADLPLQLAGESAATNHSRVLEITEPEQTFTFINVDEKPVPSLLRGFSAPVKLKFDYSLDELAWLLRCDSDGFSRWNAAQQLCLRVTEQLIEQQQAGAAMQLPDSVVEAYQALLTAGPDDLNYLTRLLALPGVGYLLANLPGVDVKLIATARNFIKEQIAIKLEAEFKRHYVALHDDNAYQYNVNDMGRRSFKNTCLAYLLVTGKPEYQELAYQQFQTTSNMTDTMGALVALNNQDSEWRTRALDEFYQQWQQQPLVVNKWLALQATAELPNTLESVKGLTQHPSFSMLNPNNIYALVCGFGANTVAFHHDNGAGYEFIADQVLAIDPHNPQVAARVIQPLTQWELVDKSRQKLMKAQLSRIAAQKNLSPDIYEIASKSV